MLSKLEAHCQQKENNRRPSKVILSPKKQRDTSLTSKNAHFDFKMQSSQNVNVQPQAPQMKKHTSENPFLQFSEMKVSKYPSTLAGSFRCQEEDFPFHDNYKNSNREQSLSAIQIKNSLEIFWSSYQKRFYEQTNKFAEQATFQSGQIEKLQKIILQNCTQLNNKKTVIEELQSKLKKQARKNSEKIDILNKALASFKQYYQQCFEYTIKRVGDIQKTFEVLSKQIDNQNSSKICKLVNQVKQKCLTIMGSCYLQSSQLRIQSIQKISDIMEQTDKMDIRISQISVKERSLQEFDMKKGALFQHMQFLKKTLQSWSQQNTLQCPLESSLVIEKNQKGSEMPKKVILKEIELKTQKLSQKMIDIEASITNIGQDNLEVQRSAISQTSRKFTTKDTWNSHTSEDSLNQPNISQPVLTKNAESNRSKTVQRQLASMEKNYQLKLREKDLQISQLQTDISNCRTQIMDLEQLLNASQSEKQEKVRQIKSLLQQLEANMQTQNKQSIQVCKKNIKCSLMSFGNTSPRFKDYSRKLPKEQDSFGSQLLNQPILFGVDDLEEQNIALKEKVQELELQISSLNSQSQQMMTEYNGLKSQYQSCLLKFEQQSSAFQQMLKVLRKQNKSIYQERENLYKQIESLKKASKAHDISMDSRPTQKNESICKGNEASKVSNRQNHGHSKSIIRLSPSPKKGNSVSINWKASQHNSKAEEAKEEKNASKVDKNCSRVDKSHSKASEHSHKVHKSKNCSEVRQKQSVQSSSVDQFSMEGGYIETSRNYENSFITNDCSSLKEAIEYCGFSVPAPCVIDNTGYLKHAYQGTYIMSNKGTLYRLSKQNFKKAQKQGVIRVVL